MIDKNALQFDRAKQNMLCYAQIQYITKFIFINSNIKPYKLNVLTFLVLLAKSVFIVMVNTEKYYAQQHFRIMMWFVYLMHPNKSDRILSIRIISFVNFLTQSNFSSLLDAWR